MSFVLIDRPRPQVTLITLNRPERMNAMAFDVIHVRWKTRARTSDGRARL